MENPITLRMISYKKAMEILEKNVKITENFEVINTENSIKRVLAQSLFSKEDYPRDNLSAMDGVVIWKNDTEKKIKIIGEIKAGDIKSKDFKSSEGKLIYTGGPVPGKNKLIVPKENFTLKSNILTIQQNIRRDFIRKRGSDFKKNQLCLKEKTLMSLRSVSLAQTMGHDKIKVFKKPKVVVILTGDELFSAKNDKPLVFSSNKIIIRHLIEKLGGEIKGIYKSKDSVDDFNRIFKNLKDFDILITSGGISKGKYDIVKKALEKNRMRILFDRIAIKPGKPTTFGKLPQDRFFLGLPGNPVSCFNSLLFFFSKFINCFYGFDYIDFEEHNLVLKKNVKIKNNLTNFLRIKVSKKTKFKIFEKQDSSMIKVLHDSDGIMIYKNNQKLIIGKSYKVILFKNFLSNWI